MIAAQYKISLPADYDMNIIRERVRNNGHSTDGFKDLKFKLYLITEKGMNGNLQNSYCPLYLWKSNEGLNEFLFNGYYDNILRSFGWQRVEVGIPLMDITTDKVADAKFCFQMTMAIPPQESLSHLRGQIHEHIPKINDAEYLVYYNPDKWQYDVVYLLNDLECVKDLNGVIYKILHISQ